jgi:PAS domain S-box-containing protein
MQWQEPAPPRLIKAIEQLQLHDHPCLIYETRAERLAVVVPFIRIGLEGNERCLCFAPETSVEIILEELTAGGIDTADALARGMLFIPAIHDIYGKDEPFIPEQVLEFLDQAVKDAKKDGLTGLRLIGEMPWALEGTSGIEPLMEYEARLNDFIHSHDMPALCLYDRARFSPESLLDVIRTHPKVIFGKVVSRNYSYLPPDEFFHPERPQIEMDHLLRGMATYEELITALEERNALLNAVIDNSPEAIYVKDLQGRYLMINPAGAAFLGRRVEEVLGRDDSEFFPADSAKKIFGANPQVLACGTPLTVEKKLTSADVTRTILATDGVYCDAKGKVIGLFGIARDITQLRQAGEEMIKTQKLESLGILAGGIAHDFNNILTAILGNVSLARIQMHDLEKATKRLEEAENATARAKDLAQQLLTFARGGEPVKKIVEISGLLKEAVGFALRGANVRCDFALADDLWPVEADEGQLVQVIHNLALNAVQAMPDGGTVTIGARNFISAQEGNRFVKISIADTGTGIPEHHLQRIFDPYFTTKQQGSGLGLATCYSIIRKHGGKIRATSTQGKGSTFHISLPATEHECALEPDSRAAVSHGNGRVLVMDDNEDIRAVAQAILEELGYGVECVADGADAVELYLQQREQGTPFSAVILDLTVPGGVGGKEAIARLLKADPDVKAIVSSGYSTDPVMANYKECGFSAVLSKPYRPQEMSKVLQELLTA